MHRPSESNNFQHLQSLYRVHTVGQVFPLTWKTYSETVLAESVCKLLKVDKWGGEYLKEQEMQIMLQVVGQLT